MMSGHPMPWELQSEVALIPDEVWEAGAKTVAAEIAKIEARFELEARIAELETENARLVTDRHGVGGNMPPESIEGLPAEEREVLERIVVVWDALDAIKEEAGKEKPDPSRFKAALGIIGAALEAIAKWNASKLDLAVNTGILTGVPMLINHLIKNPEKLQAVYEAAKAFFTVWF